MGIISGLTVGFIERIGKNMKHIETRVYNDGKVTVRMSKVKPANDPIDVTPNYDYYCESVGKDGTYEAPEEWMEENMIIEIDDIIPFVQNLTNGGWVNVTKYC